MFSVSDPNSDYHALFSSRQSRFPFLFTEDLRRRLEKESTKSFQLMEIVRLRAESNLRDHEERESEREGMGRERT